MFEELPKEYSLKYLGYWKCQYGFPEWEWKFIFYNHNLN